MDLTFTPFFRDSQEENTLYSRLPRIKHIDLSPCPANSIEEKHVKP